MYGTSPQSRSGGGGRDADGRVGRVAAPAGDGPTGRRRRGRRRTGPGARRRVRVPHRLRAGAPETAVRAPRGGCRGEQPHRVAPAVAVVEPDGGGAATDELDVEVASVADDVAQEAPVAVDLVETRIGLEGDHGARGEECAELTAGGTREALARADLGRVDLHEPHMGAVCEDDRVAVDHARDPCRRREACGGASCGVRHGGCREPDHDHKRAKLCCTTGHHHSHCGRNRPCRLRSLDGDRCQTPLFVEGNPCRFGANQSTGRPGDVSGEGGARRTGR